ncbi:hypothetical protein V2J09_015566 [Rumex salicifolius]
MTSSEIVVKIDQNDADPASVASSTDPGTNRHVHGSSFDFDGGNGATSSSTVPSLSSNRNGSGDFSFGPASASTGSSTPNIIIATEDPPSRLISQFLEQQRTAGEMVLDMDLEMDELRKETRRGSGLPPLPPDGFHGKQSNSQNLSRGSTPLPSPSRASSGFLDGTSREMHRVSFKTDPAQRRSTDYNDLGELTSSSDSDGGVGGVENGGGEADEVRPTGGLHSRRFQSYRDNAEVVRCTSNAAYDRVPTLGRNKTRSRLTDLPSEPKSAGFSTRSGQFRSGILTKGGEGEDEDYDPFFDEDLPDEYKKERIGCCAVLEWISLVLIINALFCSLLIPELRNKKLWRLKLWKWDVMILVLICGRLVSGWGIRFIVFFIERNFILRKRVLYFVYGLRNAVRNCIWLGLVLLTWQLLFDQRVEHEDNTEFIQYVTKVLVCFLVAAVVWLVKTLMVKVLASSFHVNAYFDRIQETLFNQFVIEKLSGPPSFEIQRKDDDDISISDIQRFQNLGPRFPSGDLKSNINSPRAKSDKSNMSGKNNTLSGNLRKNSGGYSLRISGPLNKKLDKRGITIDHLHKLNQKNVSAWNMKRLINIVRRGALTTLDEHMASATFEDESSKEIKSEVEAKAAARKIFHNVARPPARFIYLEDLLRFMEEDDALKTLGLFEGALESERISKSSLKNWVVNAFRGRRALTLTINDTKSAVNKLHKIVNGLVCIIILIIWLIMLNIATSKFLVFASSQVLLVAFIFGNFCKNVFESIIFLFVIHPYDVGDRCEIDTVQMVVEEMNILTTVFLRYDNQKIIFPNYILLTKPIGNFYRSPDMGDAVEFCFHILTPTEKISLARQRILSYIENKKEHWYPNPMIILKDMESFCTLKIAIWLQHKMNHQDMGERWGRRALLVEECVKVFRELDIEYRVLPWNVNIRNIPPLNFEGAHPNMNMGSVEGGRDFAHR